MAQKHKKADGTQAHAQIHANSRARCHATTLLVLSCVYRTDKRTHKKTYILWPSKPKTINTLTPYAYGSLQRAVELTRTAVAVRLRFRSLHLIKAPKERTQHARERSNPMIVSCVQRAHRHKYYKYPGECVHARDDLMALWNATSVANIKQQPRTTTHTDQC